MKKFDNIAKDQKEKAFRRGYSVPPGAINIAWAKSPTLSPKNNTIIVDTSKITTENTNVGIKTQQLAFANHLGVLEDKKGNQVWSEEYPIISDIFLPTEGEGYGQDLVDDDVLPYVHISRHFHVDKSAGFVDQMHEYKGTEIKLVYENQAEYVDDKGKRKYKIYIVPVETNNAADWDTAHRVYVFLDMNPGLDQLYLKYNKVEININGGLRNQQIDYQETINPRSYYKYMPEESDIIDYPNINQKIYSTKPVNLKKKILDIPKSNYQGWKVYVPRKALADPRIFQLFRWRLACEYTRSITPDPDRDDDYTTTIKVKVGIIVTKTGTHLNNRANYLFQQLRNSDYNFSKIMFLNPMEETHTLKAQEDASYWHVNIDTISLDDLKRYDLLVWAPHATAFDFSPYLQKLNHYMESSGGTVILETSSIITPSGIPGMTFGPRITHPTNPGTTNCVTAASMRLFDATASNPADEFSSYGGWKEWPPNVQDILTNYSDTGSILTDASPIAGWDMTVAEKNDITVYDEIPDCKLQYIATYPRDTKRVLEAQRVSDSTYQATMVHKKYTSGGNLFVSTGAIFEDHLFEPSGDMIMRTMNIKTFADLPATWRNIYNNITSSDIAASEMKLRINTVMLATVFKPSPPVSKETEIDYSEDKHSVTVYTNWFSDWIINPTGGVLNQKEIDQYLFMLKTVLPTDLEPVWQRVLHKKTAAQLIQASIKALDPKGESTQFKNLEACTKRYFLISTNPLVEMPPSSVITDAMKPTAWTEAYSPTFEIPYYRGPYQIRDEMIAGTGVGEGRRVYPPKTWAGRISATYLTSSNEVKSVRTKMKMTVTVKRDLTIDDPNVTRTVWIPAVSTTQLVLKDTTLTWTQASLGYTTGFKHQLPDKRAVGVETWTDSNYKYPGAKQTNWPHWERWGRHGHPAHVSSRSEWYGSYGNHVRGIQRCLNIFIEKGLLGGPYLSADGYYGVKTHDKIWAFQSSKGATYVDGVTDSETFSLIGHSLRAVQFMPGWSAIAAREGFWSGPGTTPYPQGQDYKHWAWQARYYLEPAFLSDHSGAAGGGNGMMRQSTWYWGQNISQTWLVRLNPNHPYAQDGTFRIYGVYVVPWGYPQYMTWMDVSNRTTLVGPHPNTNYGYPGPLTGKRAYGQDPRSPYLKDITPTSWDIKFPEKRATSVAFTTITDGIMERWFPPGDGSTHARVAVSEVVFRVRRPTYVTSTVPGYWKTTTYDPGTVSTITKINHLTYEATKDFRAGVADVTNPMDALAKQIATIMADEPARTISSRTVSSILIDSVTFPNDPSLVNYFDIVLKVYDTKYQDRNVAYLTFNGYGLVTTPGQYIQGPMIGTGLTDFYTKSTNGKIDPYKVKYGWITKDDGIRLVCDKDGKPFGFPKLPIGSATNQHFANYILDPDKVDQTTYVGLYDNNRKEWIINAAGDPEITYYDYIRRGPLNIYMGVMTTYELDIQSNLPSSTTPVDRPFKWAMPVYGVTTNTSSRFSIAPLPPDLGSTDIWPLPIRTGRFDKAIEIRPKNQGSLVGVLKDYQGKTVTAFYNVPEAKNNVWSRMFGRPYNDILNEQPIVLDDNVIQVRQYPILQVQEPTATPSLTDPWVPIMKVEVRQTLNSPWVEVPLHQIEDYNLLKGSITLLNNLPENDARLARVSYTTDTQVFNLKHDGTTRINLNPYINDKPEWRNIPIYVYLIPEYVMDSDNNIIPGTTKTRTLKVTTDATIFSPVQVNYDPLAILLGMVYITTAFDIKDLSILDTRRRGGGLVSSMLDGEADGIVSEADSLWDLIPNTATSYQRGGFAIVRLPKELIKNFSEKEVNEVIERNITAGTAFRLETLEGEKLLWDASNR